MWDIAYTFIKDIVSFLWSRFHKRKRTLSESEVVQLRQRWKQEFELKILEARISKLSKDVIIRDVNRMDSYPDGDKKKGISAWFRVGLLATYHRGIQVLLRIGRLTKDNKSGKWRYTNYQAGESGDLKVFLIGFIPYENIEAVDWDGDEYYYFPHIYCYFTEKTREPYERIAFCEEKHLDESPYYTEVADFKSVHKFSKKFNVDYFA